MSRRISSPRRFSGRPLLRERSPRGRCIGGGPPEFEYGAGAVLFGRPRRERLRRRPAPGLVACAEDAPIEPPPSEGGPPGFVAPGMLGRGPRGRRRRDLIAFPRSDVGSLVSGRSPVPRPRG